MGFGLTIHRLSRIVAVMSLIALASPAAAFGRYEGKATTIHPGAINHPGRNWTYTGDTLRVRFRNTALSAGQRQRYRVCYTRNYEFACQTRALAGPGWDSWRLRVMPPWAGYVNGRYVRYIAFSWRVGGRVVATHRAWIYE